MCYCFCIYELWILDEGMSWIKKNVQTCNSCRFEDKWRNYMKNNQERENKSIWKIFSNCFLYWSCIMSHHALYMVHVVKIFASSFNTFELILLLQFWCVYFVDVTGVYVIWQSYWHTLLNRMLCNKKSV